MRGCFQIFFIQQDLKVILPSFYFGPTTFSGFFQSTLIVVHNLFLYDINTILPIFLEVYEMKKLESMQQYNEVVEKENVILMFSADWCPDCRFIEPFIPEIESENMQFTFYYVDRDQFINLCGELSVFGIPSFVAFNRGTETGRLVNKDRKTKEEIQAFIHSQGA